MTHQERPDTPVRLTITRIDLSDLSRPGEVLLDIEETGETLIDRAVAWAEVRDYPRLVPALRRALRKPAPESGFAVLINKPHSLMILATWPWCPPAQRLTTAQ